MGVNCQKLKLLHLMQLLKDETDDEQGLTMPEIITRLEERGVAAERKSVYRDIEALRAFGLDVCVLRRSPVEYALRSRDFSLSELGLLIDAVQGSRFLTQRMSDDLVRSVKRLAPKRQRALLNKRLHVEGRIKMQNESVLSSVDLIQRAMSQRRKVSFRYYQYDASKRKVLQRDARRYQETPVQLVYAEGYYYLVAYNEKHDGFPSYRVDRMDGLRVLDDPACRNERVATYDATQHQRRSFGMYGGEPVAATLLVSGEAMGGVIDRFGKDVMSVALDEDSARVHVTVMESPTFFAWVAQFGGRIRIEKPASLVEGLRSYLRHILEAYE